MKLSTKIILPIILISALLISLSGCIIPTVTPSPGETTTGGTITGTFETPEACCMSNRDHTEGWVPLVNATVSVIDSKGVAHTTKTDSDGKYWLTDVAPGIYYVVTACCECEDREGVYKDVVEEKLKEGDTYDAGIADCESTALGLMVDYLLSGDVFVEEDCNCYCNCFDEESQIYALLVTTGVKLRVAAVNLLNPATKPLEKIRANADFQGFVVELCDLLEACCVEPGFTPPTGGTTPTVPTVSISLTKEVVDADCYTPEGTLTYTLTVTNTGDVALSDVTLNDSLLGLNDLSISDLAVGAFWTHDYGYQVPVDFEGTLINTAEVKGTGGGKTVSATASVSLEACTTPEPGKIIVKKVVTGNGSTDLDFSFVYTGPENGSFVLKHNQQKELNGSGEWTITETVPDDYTCMVDGVETNQAVVMVADGETITVTFTNEYTPVIEPGKIIVKKVVTGNGDTNLDFEFGYTGPGTGGFVLKHNEQKDLIGSGTWTITETVPDDYTCTVDGVETNQAVVMVADGETITVTFTNEYNPCAVNEPPVITDVMLNCDSIFGSNEVHLAIGTLYEVCVFATDDDGILTPDLVYSLTIDGVDIPMGTSSSGSICYSGTPLCEHVGTYEVSVNVFDGCDTTTWGPIAFIVDCDPPCCLPQFADFNPHSRGAWESTGEGATYFPNVELASINPGYNIWNGAEWAGWCADNGHGISSGWYYHRGVVCSIDPTIDPNDYYIIPYHYAEVVNWYDGSIEWNKINWIINHRETDHTMEDVQYAIWHYTDNLPYDDLSQNSKDLVNGAEGYVGTFIPEVGQKYAVILDANLRCVIQRIFIEAIRTCCCEAWHPGW